MGGVGSNEHLSHGLTRNPLILAIHSEKILQLLQAVRF
jgi:hypothetical protein